MSGSHAEVKETYLVLYVFQAKGNQDAKELDLLFDDLNGYRLRKILFDRSREGCAVRLPGG
jgi:hypothetical protein